MPSPNQQTLDIPLSSDIRSSDWLYMKKLLTDLQRELAEGKRYFLRIVANWVQAYDMLRAFEDVVMVESGDPSQSERKFFIGNLAVLKGYGIHILNILEAHNLEIPKALGVAVSDLLAMVEELGAMEKAYGVSSPAPAKKNLLEDMFGAPGR